MAGAIATTAFPSWTLAPFVVLVLAVAVLPIAAPRAWKRRTVQAGVVGACALPVLAFLARHARVDALIEILTSYTSFVAMLAALYVASGGIQLAGDLDATPKTNTLLVFVAAILASVVGTTGASMLFVRPLLMANRQRKHRGHLIPFFIVAVANAGGLLTPIGDPPLLMGYLSGVPFFWTLHLLPAWLLYVGSTCASLYVVDRRAYRRESAAVRTRSLSAVAPLELRGKRSAVLLLAIVPAALLHGGYREIILITLGALAYATTPRSIHTANGFSFAPITEVAIIFFGLFACLDPVQARLVQAAPQLPLHHGWQLFWASGLLSSVLDNAPTYIAFAALARGLGGASHGLVAGIAPVPLAAISIGCVVFGATTYIGNGPNLMVKAMAEREQFPTPGFFQYSAFALLTLTPAHLVMTLFFLWSER